MADTHLQPELDAAHNCAMAFRKARTLGAEFATQGGVHTFDAPGVPKARALSLFNLYDKTQQDLGMKVYHTIGNHDCFSIYPASDECSDPTYGKRYYEDTAVASYVPVWLLSRRTMAGPWRTPTR